MKILKVECQNLRCFEKLEMDLHPEFTLIVGENGAGKTAVLDACAIVVGKWTEPFDETLHDPRSRRLEDRDARRVAASNVAASGGEPRAAKDRATLNLNCPPLRLSRRAVLDATRERLTKAGASSNELLRRRLSGNTREVGVPAPIFADTVASFADRWLRKRTARR